MGNGSRQRTVIVSLFAILLLVTIFYSSQFQAQKAYGDGIFQHTIDAKIGDRDVKLFLRINPPVLTSESKQDAFAQFRLYDANTNVTIPHTTYQIAVTKGNLDKEKPIFNDFFHAHNGLLTLKIEPREGELTIFGTREDFQKAWVADPGGTINIRGPILLDGGLYHFNIVIFGIDFDTKIFAPGEAPEFDSWLSVGDVFHENFEYQNTNYNTTIISYYDKVNSFDFDPETSTISWSMPFDWNASRIASTQIFVHQELKIPKSVPGLGDSLSFNASASNFPLRGSMLSVDPFSSDSELTLHYLLDKAQILRMADQVPDGTQDMTFALSPRGNATDQTTGEMITDTGGINVAVQWMPNPLDADSESTVGLDFSDAFSNMKITDDVSYTLTVLDIDGDQVFRKENLVAKGGTDSQVIDFPNNESYHIEIEVTGIMKDGQAIDKTRNGIARGIVIVPEFPAGAILAIMGVFLAVLFLQRIARRNLPFRTGLK